MDSVTKPQRWLAAGPGARITWKRCHAPVYIHPSQNARKTLRRADRDQARRDDRVERPDLVLKGPNDDR
jgi:hypothetical protein